MRPAELDLPEPLRHVLASPLFARTVLPCCLLLSLALLLRVAPMRFRWLRADTAAMGALLLSLLTLPWQGSLVLLPLLWHVVTWGGLLTLSSPAVPERTPDPHSRARYLFRGLGADGLLLLASALLFWSQAGSWSTAGAGYVADGPVVSDAASVTAAPLAAAPISEVRPPDPAVEESGLPSLSLTTLAHASHLRDGQGVRIYRQKLHWKRFLRIPIDWLLLGLFSLAALSKLASGFALRPRPLLGTALLRWPPQQICACAGPMVLSLQLMLRLRALW